MPVPKEIKGLGSPGAGVTVGFELYNMGTGYLIAVWTSVTAVYTQSPSHLSKP